ncbi:MAG: TIGR03618 family F420-dependent PPOX class oxidoreductase [Actinomycetia bacterium]|nr:TIGR03618 family F420-dependent PPOX class oxidoreductase [Actinomycetes bacterium]
MPRMTSEDQETFLAEPHVGVVATVRQDGRPYTVPVWHLWDGVHFWLTGTVSRVWCRQLMHDPRLSLCVEATAPVPGHIDIDGVGEVLQPPDFNIWPISRQLAEKYVGARGDRGAIDKFFANMKTEPRLLIRVTPEVWRAIDMRVYEGKRADREHGQRFSS